MKREHRSIVPSLTMQKTVQETQHLRTPSFLLQIHSAEASIPLYQHFCFHDFDLHQTLVVFGGLTRREENFPGETARKIPSRVLIRLLDWIEFFVLLYELMCCSVI